MNSDILRELGGDIPLLTNSQLRFLEDVNLVMEDRFMNDNDLINELEDEERYAALMEKVAIMQENLRTIISRLNGGQRARRKFLKTYPIWKKVREDGIEKLREIAQTINTDRFNCNVSKLVGYCTSFVGAGITLGSAILIPFTLGLTTPLAIAGGSITAAGCGTAIGTSVTEVVLLKNRVNEAQEIIKNDKEYFQEMNDWLEHAEKLQKALSEILEFDIVKDIFDGVKKMVEKGVTIYNDLTRLNHIEKGINSILKLLPPIITTAIPIVSVITVIQVLVTIFLLMFNIEHRFVFDCASLTIRSIMGIASLADDAFDILRITQLFTSNAVLAQDLAKAVTRGAVAVLGMGLDIAAITLTSIDIHKGSLSPEAEKIVKTSDDLEEEAKILQNIYENIKEVN